MTNIIDELNQEQLKTNVPEFGPGDTVVVQVRVKEGDRERLQAFEGGSSRRGRGRVDLLAARRRKGALGMLAIVLT